MSTEKLVEKAIKNKSGYGSTRLRLKDNESPEEAIARLRKAGWLVPDLSSLTVSADEVSRYFAVK